MLRQLLLIALVSIIATSVIMAYAFYRSIDITILNVCNMPSADTVVASVHNGDIHMLYVIDLGKRVSYSYVRELTELSEYSDVFQVKWNKYVIPQLLEIVRYWNVTAYIYDGPPSEISIYYGAVEYNKFSYLRNRIKSKSLIITSYDNDVDVMYISRRMKKLGRYSLVLYIVLKEDVSLQEITKRYPIIYSTSTKFSTLLQHYPNTTLSHFIKVAINDPEYNEVLLSLMRGIWFTDFDIFLCVSHKILMIPSIIHISRLLLFASIIGLLIILDYRRNPREYEWIMKFKRLIKFRK